MVLGNNKMTTYSIGYLNDIMLRFIDRRALTARQHEGQVKTECIDDTLTNIEIMAKRLKLDSLPYQELYLSKIGYGKTGTDWM